MTRPQKLWRLNYSKYLNTSPTISLIGGPNEIRLSATPKNFINIREDGITLAPGIGKQVNIQGLSNNISYAGMIQDLPFPLSLMPVTLATPFPKQVVVPPFEDLMKTLNDLSTIAGMFLR